MSRKEVTHMCEECNDSSLYWYNTEECDDSLEYDAMRIDSCEELISKVHAVMLALYVKPYVALDIVMQNVPICCDINTETLYKIMRLPSPTINVRR